MDLKIDFSKVSEADLNRISNRKCKLICEEFSRVVEGNSALQVSDIIKLIIRDALSSDQDSFLDKDLSTIHKSVRLTNCLDRAGIRTVRQLVLYKEEDLKTIKHLGRACIIEIKHILGSFNLGLGMKL